MLKEERFDKILKKLGKGGMVTYETLAEWIGVSADTIRRDIDVLYRNGLLTKVRGGALPRGKDPLSFNDRLSVDAGGKDIIGLKAQRFIKEGMTLFLDGSTTAAAIMHHLPKNKAIRIITNCPALVSRAEHFTRLELILLGGSYHAATATTTGGDTCQEVARYKADIYCMGNCAIDEKNGSSATFKPDAEVKRAMIRSSGHVIALADHNKLHKTEPFIVAALNEMDTLITDLPSHAPELDAFRHSGLRLV